MKKDNFAKPSNLLSDNDIIRAAQQLRDEQNEALPVPPEFRSAAVKPLPSAKHRWWAAAACLVGFLAGFGVNEEFRHPSGGAETQESPVVQHIVQLDTILVRETIRDTVYQTRVVVREIPSKNVVAQASATTSTSTEELPDKPEGVGCSMLCDNIAYELLAGNGRNDNW